MNGDDTLSNANKNDFSGRSDNKNQINNEASNNTINQISQWAKQKDFLKLSNTCQNKEKINHAIEKLIEACPQQQNIIKRLVEYI